MTYGVRGDINNFGRGLTEVERSLGRKQNVSFCNTRCVGSVADNFGGVFLFQLLIAINVVKMMVGVENKLRCYIQFGAFSNNRCGFGRVNHRSGFGCLVDNDVSVVVHIAGAAQNGINLQHLQKLLGVDVVNLVFINIFFGVVHINPAFDKELI